MRRAERERMRAIVVSEMACEVKPGVRKERDAAYVAARKLEASNGTGDGVDDVAFGSGVGVVVVAEYRGSFWADVDEGDDAGVVEYRGSF